MFLLMELKFKILILTIHAVNQDGGTSSLLRIRQLSQTPLVDYVLPRILALSVTQTQVFLQHSERDSIQTSIAGKLTTKCL